VTSYAVKSTDICYGDGYALLDSHLYF